MAFEETFTFFRFHENENISVGPSASIFSCLPACLPTCLPTSLPVYLLPVRPCVYLSICLSVCLFVSLFESSSSNQSSYIFSKPKRYMQVRFIYVWVWPINTFTISVTVGSHIHTQEKGNVHTHRKEVSNQRVSSTKFLWLWFLWHYISIKVSGGRWKENPVI